MAGLFYAYNDLTDFPCEKPHEKNVFFPPE
jgi:hypothetical protein